MPREIKKRSVLSEIVTHEIPCNQCQKLYLESQLETIEVKKGRTRDHKLFCEDCKEEYLSEILKITITIPRRYEILMEQNLKKLKKCPGYETINKSDVIRRGLDCFFKENINT